MNHGLSHWNVELTKKVIALNEEHNQNSIKIIDIKKKKEVLFETLDELAGVDNKAHDFLNEEIKKMDTEIESLQASSAKIKEQVSAWKAVITVLESY